MSWRELLVRFAAVVSRWIGAAGGAFGAFVGRCVSALARALAKVFVAASPGIAAAVPGAGLSLKAIAAAVAKTGGAVRPKAAHDWRGQW